MSPEAWSALANWVMAVAAVAAAGAAILGINSWKNQNAWLMERDASRLALRSLLRLASEVSEARKPEFMRLTFGKAERIDLAYPAPTASDREHRILIESVQQAQHELETAMFDLEYLGDSELRQAWESVDLLVSRYLAQTDMYLAWKNRGFAQDEKHFFRTEEQRKDNYGVVFHSFSRSKSPNDDEHNDFNRKLSISVKDLERKLAKRLGRKE